MTERRVEELMRRPAPGEREATARAHEVARAAFEERAPDSEERVRLLPALAVVAVAAAAVALALTPAGGAIADLIREGLGEPAGERPAEPALTSLPSGGELIVVSGAGPWVVRSDGSQRLLGRYDDASWSPRGLFVIATDEHQLTALTPTGEARWSLSRPAPVSGARWSPWPGYRVAYRSGRSLRVVAGDGTGDSLEARAVASTPPAWRPGAGHVLAFADDAGRIELRDVDRDRSLWRSAPGEPPVQLAWSADGERLAAVGRRNVRIFAGDGRLLAVTPLPAGLPAAAARGSRLLDFATEGHRFALVRAGRAAGQSEVVLLRAEERPGPARRLFSGPGSFSEVVWSPDGRSLLVGWPGADQFLFVRPDRPRRVTAVSNVASQFSPGAGRGAEFPRISDWCCDD